MSQIVAPNPLTYLIPDSSWDKPSFSPTLNTETFTPNHPHHAHPPSLPYSVSSISSTSSLPTNYSLGMRVSPDFAPKNGQLCLATQVLEPSLTPHTPAIPLAFDNAQFESHRENMLPSSRDFSVPSGLQDSRYINMVSHGMVGNYSLPLDDGTVPYPLPNVEHQATLVQGQPNAPKNQGHALLGYAPQHIALGAAQDSFKFPDPIVRSPGQPTKEDLRRRAIRYLCHPGSRVDMDGTECWWST